MKKESILEIQNQNSLYGLGLLGLV